MTPQDPSSRSITIRYFAWVRERIGRSEERLDVPGSVETIAELIAWLRARDGMYDDAFKHPGSIRAAIDRVHVKPDAAIGQAREIGFFPPVTGG